MVMCVLQMADQVLSSNARWQGFISQVVLQLDIF
jgi:hypothetical protein